MNGVKPGIDPLLVAAAGRPVTATMWLHVSAETGTRASFPARFNLGYQVQTTTKGDVPPELIVRTTTP